MIPNKPYSQWKAIIAIARASFRAMLRSPSAVVFSIFFPLVFILVFGFIGGGGGTVYKLVLANGSDTSNSLLDSLKTNPSIRFLQAQGTEQLESDLLKGRITGVLDIRKDSRDPTQTRWVVGFKSTTASGDKIAGFLPILENTIHRIDRNNISATSSIARVETNIREVRKYRTIDFILPGQLGFSLLSAGVFGVAFLFFNLRQQLVIKRFFATPVSKTSIVLGEGLSRVVFQLITAVIIIGLGHYAFHFTLVNGWITFAEILVLSFIALLVFMGFGFVVSALAKTEASIPPLANIVTLPQFLLAGTFFSIDAFPPWLQPISRAMPLTYFNDAMRKIAFEGAHLSDCWFQITILLAWGLAIYFVAVKIFRWD